MDVKLLGLLSILLIAALLPEAECWWHRRWRIHRVPSRPTCGWTCPRVCTYVNVGCTCRFQCQQGCGRKKRGTEGGPKGHVTPIPRNFDFYDLNEDGSIELEEIETTLGETKANCEEMFKLTDTRPADGKLSLDEFENGPLVFEKYPGETDDDDDQEEGGEKPGQGAGNGNQGNRNQGNKPDQRSIEFDEY